MKIIHITEEQSNEHNKINRKLKNEFQKTYPSFKLEKYSVVHHIDSSFEDLMDKHNIVIIPGLKDHKQFSSLIHKLLEEYVKHQEFTCLDDFITSILNYNIFYYDGDSPTQVTLAKFSSDILGKIKE